MKPLDSFPGLFQRSRGLQGVLVCPTWSSALTGSHQNTAMLVHAFRLQVLDGRWRATLHACAGLWEGGTQRAAGTGLSWQPSQLICLLGRGRGKWETTALHDWSHPPVFVSGKALWGGGGAKWLWEKRMSKRERGLQWEQKLSLPSTFLWMVVLNEGAGPPSAEVGTCPSVCPSVHLCVCLSLH